MAFFEDFAKKVGDVTKSAVQKSEEMIEVTKLNRSIGAEEGKIKEIYSEMGLAIYNKFKSGADIDPDLSDNCRQISEIEKNIEALKEKIIEVKREKEEAQAPKPVQNAQPQPAEVKIPVQANALKCPSCGEPYEEGKKFCAQCGAKL